MLDTPPNGTSAEPRKKRLHTLYPIPLPPSWREEIYALKDVTDGLAVALWRALRNVRVWAQTEPDRRKRLFNLPSPETRENMGYACAHAPELIEAFGTFAFLLRSPDQATTRQVADACRMVHEWAEARSLVPTAVHFAETAAIVESDDPALANDAGWMCFRAALHERAAAWYQRGFGLAVRLRGLQETVSREQSIRALLRYGILMRVMGRHDEARRYYQRAAHKAAATGRLKQAGKAKHDLLTIAAEVGTYEEGHRYAIQALDLYPRNSPELPALAHDWAFLLVRFRHFTQAIPILQLALPLIRLPEVQTVVWSTLARAAAGARRQDLFRTAEEKVLPLVRLHDEYAPAALIHLAEGARVFGDWERAEEYVRTGLEVARSRKQALQERDSLALLEKIAAREVGPVEEDPRDIEGVRMLSRRFRARLQQWKAPGSPEPGAPKIGDALPLVVESQPPEPIV